MFNYLPKKEVVTHKKFIVKIVETDANIMMDKIVVVYELTNIFKDILHKRLENLTIWEMTWEFRYKQVRISLKYGI